MIKAILFFLRQQTMPNSSFQHRIFQFLLIIIGLQLFLTVIFFHKTLNSSLEYQMTSKALIQAQEIASDPNFIELMQQNNKSQIKIYAKRLQKISDADFIVIGDNNGIRLVHPEVKKVGLPMVGDDSLRALKEGDSYTTINKGSLGMAIRGKAGIVTPQGTILGVVSVGYLLTSVSERLMFYFYPAILTIVLLLLCSSLGAWVLTQHIKRQMFDMEPEEIAMSLHLKRSILQSVYEGIVAVNKKGTILSINVNALQTLGIAKTPEALIGCSINEFITPASFFLGANSFGEFTTDADAQNTHQDELITCNGETLVVNRVNIYDDLEHIGWVVSFRRRNDYNMLTSQISQIHQHNENLRVLNHEYANRLSTISGLIQIGAYDEAIQTICDESEEQQHLIDFITRNFSSKIIAGLLLGKYSRAKELGLTLKFDPTCQLQQNTSGLSSGELAAILGNLLDNAYEATLKNPNSNKIIQLLLLNTNQELIIEIADNGTGIADDMSETLFTKGVSSKKYPGHGIGLYLIQQYVTQVDGSILIDKAEQQGTIFSIFIPNKSNKNETN
ncbi:MAG: two-component system cit operon sensor histidine kinase CitA [Psychromonas sp.]|jgi:two-component system cit operon sensor histidine kinase CitA